jgi:phosphoglycerate dehydrogenase-like enzyme
MIVVASKAMPFNTTQWQSLEQALRPHTLRLVDFADPIAAQDALDSATVALVEFDADHRFRDAPKLRWVHCDKSGLDGSLSSGILEAGKQITGSAGRSAPALAEHAMMFSLMLCSDYARFFRAQLRAEWVSRSTAPGVGALNGRTMGIIGLGNTGAALAGYAKAFGMEVLAYKRRAVAAPESVDKLFSRDHGDTIEPLLRQSDIVVLTLGLNDATRHLIGAEQFEMMGPRSFIVNMSRGEIVDQDALVAALEAGKIAGAAIDVTTPEPLPNGHRLWTAPNLLITPHTTAAVQDRAGRTLAIFLENFRRFCEGQPLLNAATSEDVLTGRGA